MALARTAYPNIFRSGATDEVANNDCGSGRLGGLQGRLGADRGDRSPRLLGSALQTATLALLAALAPG